MEAEKAYRRTLDLFVKLAADFPAVNVYPQIASEQRLNLGQFLVEAGRAEDALDVYRQEIDHRVKLAADAPTKLNHWQGLVRTHVELGRLLAKTGKKEEAETAYRQAAEIQEKLEKDFANKPEYRHDLVQSHWQAAHLFHEAGRPHEAERIFQLWRPHSGPELERIKKAAEADPKNGLIWGNLAVAYYRAGKWQDSLDIYKTKEHLGYGISGSAWQWFDLAMVHWQLNHKEEAYSWYYKSLTWVENAQEKRLLALQAEAAALMDLANPGERPQQAWTYNQTGTDLQKQGKEVEAMEAYGKAIDVYEKLWVDFPAVTIYRTKLVDLLNRTGRGKDVARVDREAISSLEQLAAAHPKMTVYRQAMGQLYRELGQWDKAAEIATDLDDPELNNIAWQIVASSAPDPQAVKLAVGLAQKAVARAPDARHIVNTLGTAYYRAGDWKAAIETLTKADEMYAGWNFSFNAFFIAMAHEQLGENEQARKWYAPALVWMAKHAPENEELLRFRAEAASLLGLPERLSPEHEQVKADGLEYYTLVLEAHPKADWAWSKRGASYAELGQWKEAMADFAKAVELKKDDPLHRYRQALARLQLGDVEGYRNVCADMLEQFDPAAKTDSARWAVWTCVLAADAVADWKVPLQLAEKAAADNPKNYRALNHHGSVLYRAGQSQEAIERLTEAEAAYQPDDQKQNAIACNWLFLAMAQQRLGHDEEAKKWRDKAVQWIDQEMQKMPTELAAANPLPWNRRLTLQLLRCEAEELLKQK